MTDAATDWERLACVFSRLASALQQGRAEAGFMAFDLAEERAAILEYCANHNRHDAERLANLMYGSPLPVRYV